jgi:hypothetical protein
MLNPDHASKFWIYWHTFIILLLSVSLIKSIPGWSILTVDYILHTLVFFDPYQHVVPMSLKQKCELRDVI